MEIYQLKVFLEVARHLSFTEAADALNLTQPAVSAKIKSLESELGTALFYRLGRKVKLTRVGQFLLEEGPQLIHLEARLIQKIEEIKQGKNAKLRIGCVSGISDSWLPKYMFEYRQRHPETQTQCLQLQSTEQLYRAIINSEVDVGISDISFSEFDEISATQVDTVQYSLIVASDHALAQKDWLSLRELRQEPWVLLAEGTPSRLVFDARLAELGLQISDFPNLETVDTLGLMRTYILQGHYLGFVSGFEFPVECQTCMKRVPLQEFALAANLFLVLPRRLSQAASELNEGRAHSRSTHTEPVQAFVELVQSLTQPRFGPTPDSAAQPEPRPTGAPQPVRWRSPSFLTRSAHARPDHLTINIGTQNGTIQTVTAGLIIQRLGLLEHFLPQTGRYSATQYQIQWRDFSSGAPIVEGLRFQKLDIGVLGDYPLLLSAIQPEAVSPLIGQTRLVSFIASNPDGSGNAVIVPQSSHLNSIEDLRGRVIAVPFSSSAHGMIMRSLHDVNLLQEVTLTSIKDLNINGVAPHQAVDGYAHFAPFAEIVRRRSKFRCLFDGNLNGLPAFHGVVVRESLAEDHPDIVTAYLKALLAAQYWYLTTPSAPALVSQWIRLDPEIVTGIIGGSGEQPGLYFSETQIRPDWIHEHVSQLKHVSGNEYLSQINLTNWIQTDFLQQAHASLR